MRKTTILMIILLSLIYTSELNAKNTNNLTELGVGMHGYDPVSYHQQKPIMGSDDFVVVHSEITYKFGSKKNREMFTQEPDRYLPAYGGWCAWAMLEGKKVDVDPERYKIINGTTHLYYNSFFLDTLKKWNKLADSESETELVKKASAEWQVVSSSP